jgi:hypothetical protein
MSEASQRIGRHWARLILPLVYGLSLGGCASIEPEPTSLAQQKELAMRQEYRRCYHDALHAAWFKKWDEHYMSSAIEQACSERVGRPYYRARVSPRLSLY